MRSRTPGVAAGRARPVRITAQPRRSCAYSPTPSRNRKRFGRRSKLAVRVRFLGSDRLVARRVRTLKARVR